MDIQQMISLSHKKGKKKYRRKTNKDCTFVEVF